MSSSNTSNKSTATTTSTATTQKTSLTSNTTTTNTTATTTKHKKVLDALQKTKSALIGISNKLQPVLDRLNHVGNNSNNNNNNNKFSSPGHTAQAKATVALSIGMMKYMSSRLRGLDHGRKENDPLRNELNHMKQVLAELKQKYSTTTTATTKAKTTPKRTNKSTSDASTPSQQQPAPSLDSTKQKDASKKRSTPEKSDYPDSKKQRKL